MSSPNLKPINWSSPQSERTGSHSAQWKPVTTVFSTQFQDLTDELRTATPANRQLIELAHRARPDPHWFEQDHDPFRVSE